MNPEPYDVKRDRQADAQQCAECGMFEGADRRLYRNGDSWFCQDCYDLDWDNVGDPSRLLEAGRDAELAQG